MASFFKFLKISSIDLEKISFAYSLPSIDFFENLIKSLKLKNSLCFFKLLSISLIFFLLIVNLEDFLNFKFLILFEKYFYNFQYSF